MNNAFLKVLPKWVASFTFFTLCACSYVNEVEVDSQQPSAINESSVVLRIPAFKVQTTVSVKTIDIFQFSDGIFVKKVTVDPSKDNVVKLDRKPGTKIYAMAGYTVEVAHQMSEKDFSTMTIPVPKDSCSAPSFFSSVTSMLTDEDNINIKLYSGVARLDIDNQDPALKIEKVSISGAASSSHIFQTDGKTCETQHADYLRTFKAGIEGLEERAFVLFETSSPITVTISGRRNGEAVEVVSETPVIVRNTIYTVCIDNEGSNNKERSISDPNGNSDEEDFPRASIKVRSWEDGDKESGSIDLGESAIDIGRSTIPAGVTINSSDNTVTVPAEGVSGMKLAFVTHAPLELGSALSDMDGVSVTPITSSTTDYGYISEFKVDVAKQPKCAAHYQASIFFNGSSNFFINIEVEASPYQIPTVHIGGHDWMCFNAVSQDPEEQIFLTAGMTVDQMYNNHFADCIGNMFQYGRPNPFSPWTANDPNRFADQARDVPWETKSMMPLPKGYHVPSSAEWQDLIPDGIIIPASYRTRAGDSIRATIVTLPGTLDGTPSAATNAQNYLKRGVLFESLTTGARLFLPMAGIKTDTSAEIPTDPAFRFDNKSGYWMKEKQQVMLLQCEKGGDGSYDIKLERNNWYADGFVMVRGIKD